MKSFKNSVVAALAVSAFTLSGAHAASWQDSLNSAASQLSGSNAQASGGMSVSSLTSLLNGSSQSLTASSMNNAAGILSYCAKQKLASVTSADNVKNQVLDKLGLSTPEKQKQDTSYLDGLQGLAGLEIAKDHMELIQKFMIEGPQGVQHGPGAGQLV